MTPRIRSHDYRPVTMSRPEWQEVIDAIAYPEATRLQDRNRILANLWTETGLTPTGSERVRADTHTPA